MTLCLLWRNYATKFGINVTIIHIKCLSNEILAEKEILVHLLANVLSTNNIR